MRNLNFWYKSNSSVWKVATTVIIAVCAIFFIYPMLFVIINSFRPNADIIVNPTGLPLKPFFGNYVQAWAEMNFPKVFLNTLLVTVLGTGGIILFSAMCAYGLARSNTKISWILYGFFAFYLVIPFQIIMVPLGVLAADLHLMSVPGLIPMYWGLGCPTAIFMFHGFIKSVPKELEESAAIDGAKALKIRVEAAQTRIDQLNSRFLKIEAQLQAQGK